MKKLLPILIFCLFCLNCEQGWLNEIINPTLTEGCTNSNTCNYNLDATEDDGSCIAKQGCNEWCEGDSSGVQELDCEGVCGGTVFDSDGDGACDRLRLLKGELDTSIGKIILTFSYSSPSDINGYYLIRNSNEIGEIENYSIIEDIEGSFSGGLTIEYIDSTSTDSCPCDGLMTLEHIYQIKALDDSNNGHYSNELIVNDNCPTFACDEDENNQTDCSDPNTCSNCTGCEASCCPNYCSGNYYYYNRSCSNGFCVGATSDYCSDGCNDDGCIESTYGCTNPSACNFDANATIFDDSCWSATEGCACSDGEGSVADNCGTCDTDSSNDCVQDCNDEWGGTAVLSGCDNLCNSTKENDCAGVCGGTHADSDCGTVTDIDGNTYKTIKIGTQNWMAENLNVTHYKNDEEISNLTGSNFSSGGNCEDTVTEGYIVSDNNSSQAVIYGNLYNWSAVSDSRGLCMEGWHVPSDAEWTILSNYLGGEDVAGGKLKSIATSSQGVDSGDGLWDTPNVGATNESGFTALPSGQYFIGGYTAKGAYSYFWSSTIENPGYAYHRRLYKSETSIRDGNGAHCNGFSIRCLKD